MDELRLILIGVGVALLAGIYVAGVLGQRRRRRSRDGREFPGFGDADEVDAEEFIERLHDRQAAINAEDLTGDAPEAEPRAAEIPVRPDPARGPAEPAAQAPAAGPGPGAPRASAPAASGRPASPAPAPRARGEQQELFDDLAGLSALGGDAGPEVGDLGALGPEPAAGPAMGPAARKGRRGAPAPSPAKTEAAPVEPLVLALTVMARDGERLAGDDLRAAFAAEALEHGPFGIFHWRAAGRPRSAPPEFSVANVVKPGTFDPASMSELATPGLALFVQLPGPRDPGEAFEQMLLAGRRLAERLDAVLCDETRSTLTGQSVNHLRERIAEFTRRTRLRK